MIFLSELQVTHENNLNSGYSPGVHRRPSIAMGVRGLSTINQTETSSPVNIRHARNKSMKKRRSYINRSPSGKYLFYFILLFISYYMKYLSFFYLNKIYNLLTLL